MESPFAAVRLRTAAAKRFKKVENATAVIWKTLLIAEQTFRRLDAPELLADVAEGVVYVNGVRREPSATRRPPPDLIYTLLDKTSRLRLPVSLPQGLRVTARERLDLGAPVCGQPVMSEHAVEGLAGADEIAEALDDRPQPLVSLEIVRVNLSNGFPGLASCLHGVQANWAHVGPARPR